MHEYIQVVADRCRACRRCEMACIAAHHGITIKEATKRRDELVSRAKVVKTDLFKASLRCHQCDPAPCCAICPTGALRQANGSIIMHEELCAACKMCIAVCPYGAIAMETIGMPGVSGDEPETMAQRARREVAVRCDMCEGWREENGKRITACVEACPARALSLVLPDGTVIEAPPKPAKETAAAQNQ
ncbi:MAG: 4Fe-4S dicluster domain-containing protein [Desulfovibrio sp.]|nr:4Fe-4S dicluster domain-containing protein [Desulfovibrio sp.]